MRLINLSSLLLVLFLFILILISPTSIYAYSYFTGSTGSTSYNVSSGSISDITDNNVSTCTSLNGFGTVNNYPFYIIDLGTVKAVQQVQIVQFKDTSGGAGDFKIRYSNSPLDDSNTGTQYSTDLNVTATYQDFTRTANVSARYWGIYRPGNWTGSTFTMCDFSLYGADPDPTPTPTSTATPTSSPTATSSAELVTAQSDSVKLLWVFMGIIVFTAGAVLASNIFKR